tara:strand:+ start:1087 stop:1548 length:462 start_codon:yes stop_codon:yes gene_type:complete
MTVIRRQIELILEAEKLVATGRKFRAKAHPDYKELKAEVFCATFPEFNLLYRCIFHCSREPRKISHLLTADGQRIFALDINPGGSHRNLITLESVSGTHWQVGPDCEAEADERVLNPAQWHHEFAKRAGLKFEAYEAPAFMAMAPVIADMFGA